MMNLLIGLSKKESFNHICYNFFIRNQTDFLEIDDEAHLFRDRALYPHDIEWMSKSKCIRKLIY